MIVARVMCPSTWAAIRMCAGSSIATEVAAYRGTEYAEALRRNGVPANTGVGVSSLFDDLTRSPIRVVGTTGLDFTLEPRTVPFSELGDAYVLLGS